MLAAALITCREGLEAALIIGIILAVLRQVNRPDWRSAVWWGVATAEALSLIAGLALYAVGARWKAALKRPLKAQPCSWRLVS